MVAPNIWSKFDLLGQCCAALHLSIYNACSCMLISMLYRAVLNFRAYVLQQQRFQVPQDCHVQSVLLLSCILLPFAGTVSKWERVSGGCRSRCWRATGATHLPIGLLHSIQCTGIATCMVLYAKGHCLNATTGFAAHVCPFAFKKIAAIVHALQNA